MSNEKKSQRLLPLLSDKLRAAPLLKALVPMVAGVALGALVAIPLYVWVISTVVCGATAGLALWRRRGGVFATLYVGLSIVFFGAALARVHTPRDVIPRGERVWIELMINDNPTHRAARRSASTFGIATRWRPEDGEWRAAGERLMVSIDTMWSLAAGDRVTFTGYVNPVSDTLDNYARLMRARGYTGRTYISQYSRPGVVSSVGDKTPAAWARRLQSAATARLARLGKLDKSGTPDDPGASTMTPAIAVAAAMTTGDRTGITPELRRAYSRTGASHLLAVSGLHVGIVFLIINTLLLPVPFVRRGHILKNVVAVAAIWAYAALTGLSPSATRAAVMFTGAQIALAASQTRGAVNIMCGTALMMLAVKPGLLFDISFQLSFIAVASILAWFGPLYRLVESRWWLLNALWATLVIGFVATVATMPLVSHTFGVFSLAGVVLNPLVIATAYMVVGFSLLWIVSGISFLEPVFGWLIESPARLQNRVVESVAGVSGAAVEWAMPLWAVFASYGAMIIFTAWLAGRPGKSGPEPLVLPR